MISFMFWLLQSMLRAEELSQRMLAERSQKTHSKRMERQKEHSEKMKR